MAMTVVVIVVVTIYSTLIFQGGGMGQGKGVVASFQLVLEKSRSWSFLQVGSLKSGGCSLLLVGAIESGSWIFLQVRA
jgi:hypothetical protein